MKNLGCKGFENFPCYNRVEDAEFSKALKDGRPYQAWSCNEKEYYKLFVDSKSKIPLKVDGTNQECPKLAEKRKKFQALSTQKEEIMTFENFDISLLENPEIVEEIKEFPNTKFKRLLLIGNVGVGKTHLASALINQINSLISHKVIKVTAADLYDLFFDSFRIDTANQARAKIEEMLKYWFIFIDDLGEEKHTESEIFNQRFKTLIDKFPGRFIITSNLSYDDMEKLYGEKIASRLYHNVMIRTIKAGDYRKRSLHDLKITKRS
jgi:DNA replication protein DnaC